MRENRSRGRDVPLVQDAFWTVLLVVVIGGAVVAVITFVGTGKLYDQIGRGGLSLREDDDGRGGAGAARRRPRPRPPASATTRSASCSTARNERRARRGQAPLDVEAELRAADRRRSM